MANDIFPKYGIRLTHFLFNMLKCLIDLINNLILIAVLFTQILPPFI